MPSPTNLARLRKLARRSSKNRLAVDSPFDLSIGRPTEKALGDLLKKGAPDLARLGAEFEQLARKGKAEVAREVKQMRALAVRHSRDQKGVVAQAVAARTRAFELLADPGGGARQSYFLNSPFEIAANFTLNSSAIVPANSRAKFTSDVSDGTFDTKQIYFNYYWVNPFDKYVVFNVSGYAVAYGNGQIEAYGGVILGESFARVFCTAQLNVEDWTTDSLVPLGFPLYQGLFDDEEDRSGFLQSSSTSLPTWFRGCDLQYPSAVIRPGGTVGIGVTIELQSQTENGRVYADFSSADHRVSSPGVLITVVS